MRPRPAPYASERRSPISRSGTAGYRSRAATRGSARAVDLALGAYDARLPLVVDPTLDDATYLGGVSYEDADAVVADASGAMYLTGQARSVDFPIANAIQPTLGDMSAGGDAYLLKMDASGSSLVYSTFLGGRFRDEGNAVAVAVAGTVYVAGESTSDDFPTRHPYQAHLGNTADGILGDALLVKIGGAAIQTPADTVGVVVPSNGTWFLRNANAPGPADVVFAYGPPGSVPVTGSWSGV